MGSKSFKRVSGAAMLTLALMFGASTVHAADACFQGVGGNILVFKKFKMPRAGDCTPIQGFQHNSECTVSGTACGTSDGALVKYNFDLICHFHGFGTYAFDTDRSILQGDGVFCQVNTANGQYSCPTSIVSRVTCPAPETFTDF